jgi:hypothetical protein
VPVPPLPEPEELEVITVKEAEVLFPGCANPRTASSGQPCTTGFIFRSPEEWLEYGVKSTLGVRDDGTLWFITIDIDPYAGDVFHYSWDGIKWNLK